MISKVSPVTSVALFSVFANALQLDRRFWPFSIGADSVEHPCDGDFARSDSLIDLLHALDKDVGKPIKQALSGQKGPVMLTISTRHVACMHDNFVVNAARALTSSKQKRSSLSPTVILAVNLDEHSLEHCKSHPLGGSSSSTGIALQLLCVDLVGWLPKQITDVGPEGKVDNIGFGSCGYHFLVWTKPVLLKYAARHSEHGILLLDSDIVLQDNLLDWVKANRKDGVALLTEQWLGKPWPSTGAVFADQNSIPLLRQWVAACTANPRFVGDTEQLKDLITNDKRVKLQFIPNDVLGECARNASVAVHYNCVSSKVSAMESDGNWNPREPLCK